MPARMQIRLWMRQARPSQVWSVGAALALALFLVAISLSPNDVDRASTAAAGSLGGGAPVGGGGESGAPTTDTSAPGTAVAPSGGATRSGTPTVAGGTRTTAAAGPTTTQTTARPAPLTASDVGVTPDSVKIGFVEVNLGGLDRAGFALGQRTDISQVIDAYVDDVNRQGGINGRSVVAVKRGVDPLSQEDQTAGCQYFLNDQKVFGVVESQVYVFEATQRCFTLDGKAPFTHGLPLSKGFQAQAGGLDVSTIHNYDRIAADWVAEAVRSGFVGAGTRAGVFTDSCQPGNGIIENVLIPGLKAAGASVELAEIDCAVLSQQTQVPTAVLKMKTAQVTNMFMATFFVGVQSFLSNADGQAYKPSYFSSPWNSLDQDAQTQRFSTSQWDRVRGFTTTFSGWQAAGHLLPDSLKRCSTALTSHGLPGLEYTAGNAEAIIICDDFRVMVEAARAAGRNLTRKGWAQAVAALPPFEAALAPSVAFGPGKYDGGDTLATIEWRRECTCWVQISGYRPGRA